MARLVTEEKATTKTGETEEIKATLNGTTEQDSLELIWSRGLTTIQTDGALDHKTSRKLVIFLVALSLLALTGIVVDMGLRYSFSKPWLWEW